MKKRIACLLLCAAMLLPLIPARVSAANTAAQAAYGYLRQYDYIVVSPAERWQNGRRVAVATTEWELTAQHSGTANGNDVQTWKYGVSDKFHIPSVSTINGISYVRIQAKNFRESKDGRYWDIKGRSKKTGGNVHVWSYKDSDSQWFYLEEDYDGDPETFFIKNKNSNLYIVPRDYFKNPKNNCSEGRNSWSEEGCNLEQSNYAFRWRIQVLNRDAATEMGKTDKYANWMSMLPDSRYLSDINIPGTHDSGTANVEGSWNSSTNFVSCQKYFIEQQLYAGVRSLDIRTAWNNDSRAMVLVHGSASNVCHTPDHNGNAQNKTFSSVLKTISKYLNSHPTETVIMTLKIDGGSEKTGVEQLASDLTAYLADPQNARIYSWNNEASYGRVQSNLSSPKLGDVRGKLVIFSRVNFRNYLGETHELYKYLGPDLTQWDASYNDRAYYLQKIKSGSAVNVYIQDDYSSPDDNKKKQVYNAIKDMNGNLSGSPNYSITSKDFVFNYTSKTTGSSYGATPLGGAKYMNNLLYNDGMFTPNTKEAKENPRLGIVVMDYVNKQLCRRIIDRNTFPSSSGMKIMELINPGLIAGLSADGYALDGFDGLMLDPDLYTADFGPYSENLPAFAAYEAADDLNVADNTAIVWPVSAELTYGYVLGEATLHFNQTGGKEGTFQFENEEEILAATETTDETGAVVKNEPVSKTLTFTPADGSAPVSQPINVTVHKRPLPIKISNIEAEYGGAPFSRADIEVTAGGYLLESDLKRLPEIIESEQIHWVLTYEDGREIPLPDVPPTDVVTRGTIALKAENVSDSAIVRFPNYAYTIELGTWEIVPRTVTVAWNYTGGSWQASIGNVLPGDEVYPVMTDEGLTLGGAKADCYQVAEDDLNPPDYIPVTPSAPAQKPQNEPTVMPFTDIASSHYAKDAIQWAWENGYCDGVSAAEFAPDQGLSRAMLVTILWRMAEKPHEISSGFRDVPDGKWYSEAIAWAASLDLVSGAAPGLFAPNAPITREQLAVILWRYAGSPKASAALRAYSDGGQVSAYAREAMAWSVEAGILTGANGRLMPKAGATRAQAVLMLQRFDALMHER